jgi:PilZ domain
VNKPRQHNRVVSPFEGRMGDLETPVRIYDLSEGGCLISSLIDAHTIGRRFVLTIDLSETEHVTVEAEVVNARPEFGFGARFVGLQPAAVEQLHRALDAIRDKSKKA